MVDGKSASSSGRRSLDELVDDFDNRKVEDLESLPRVDMEVDIRHKRHLVAIDEDVLARVGELAKKRNISSEELINALLRERVLETPS